LSRKAYSADRAGCRAAHENYLSFKGRPSHNWELKLLVLAQRAGTLRRMLTQLAFQSRRAAVELTTIALSACRYFAPHAYSACLPKSPSCCRADDNRALSVQVLCAAGLLSLPSKVAELLSSWQQSRSQRAGTLRRRLTQLAFQSRRAAVELTIML